MDVEEAPTIAMEEDHPSSPLFQIPISQSDFDSYRTPSTQPVEDPRNCATVSAFFVDILTPREAEQLSALSQTPEVYKFAYLSQWIKRIAQLTDKNGFITGPLREVVVFRGVLPELFPSHATIVIKERIGASGHAFVVARDSTGQIGIIDPQIRKWYTDIESYLSEAHLNDAGPFRYIAYATPQTIPEIDRIASRIRAVRGCRIAIGGKTRRRKPTASSPPSGPKRSGPSVASRRWRSGRRTRAYSKRKVGY